MRDNAPDTAPDTHPAIETVADGLGFPEGPVALADGSVLFVDLRHRTLERVDADRRRSVVADCGGGPNGLALGPDGAAYVCDNGGSRFEPGSWRAHGAAPDYQGGSIQRVDLATGAVTALYTECDGHRLSAPNDLVFDHEGGFYFTDFGKNRPRHREHGGIYYARADGSHIRQLVYPFLSANGIALSPDERTLYVAETETGRVWAFDIESPGALHRAPFPSPHGGRLLHGLPGYQRLDSMAVDSEGNVCVATLMSGCITVIAPDGTLLRQVPLPDIYVTNLCFGGDDLRTAYVTLAETGRLVALRWPVAGWRLNFSG